jgi:putative YphP/YqiW family bacilliredoxin
LRLRQQKKWIARLGGKRWQRLHRLIYISAIGGVLHYLWLVKLDITNPVAIRRRTRGIIAVPGLDSRPSPSSTQRRVTFMPYPEILIKPMRDELTQLGVQETRTPEEVDAAVNSPGTTMVIVNSVCGCAAGKARPASRWLSETGRCPTGSLPSSQAPISMPWSARAVTSRFSSLVPVGRFVKKRRLVYLLQRHQIEGREAVQIASDLKGRIRPFLR